MKLVIAGLLAAVLIQLAPSPDQHLNETGQEKAAVAVRSEKANQATPQASEASAEQAPVQSQPEKVAEQPSPKPTVLNDQQAILQAAGVPSTDWPAVEFIFHKESTWRPTATNQIGCIGLGQNCPDKNGNLWLTDACPNWQTDPVCQVKRFSHYATERYGGWWFAHTFWIENGWW